MKKNIKLKENKDFLTNQIITYLGNKRSLIKYIENEIKIIHKKINKEKMIIVDLFSGSGIVSRMLKKYSEKLIVNDLEKYSFLINKCYLTNKNDFNFKEYNKEKNKLLNYITKNKHKGIIYNNYAPKNTNNILKNERVFYTTENAILIDTIRKGIEELINDKYKNYFLAPLLVESSIKNNTAGIFKGFYKDKTTGIGKFGGSGEYALSRIKSKIIIKEPIFSEFNCEIEVYQEDANILVKKISKADIVYLDPPYNQHPYGSNYFMLNIIANNEIKGNMSKVSGIPSNWNRSIYNKKKFVFNEFKNLINNINSDYIIISYNSEGFLTIKEIKKICETFGQFEIKEIPYNTFRGCRNLSERNLYVSEYLIILEKRGLKNEN